MGAGARARPLSIWRRRRVTLAVEARYLDEMRRSSLAVAAALVVLSACSSSHPEIATGRSPVGAASVDGVVFGGIEPCSALPPSLTPNLATYAAGLVTVFAGRLYQPSQGEPIFPSTFVAQESVHANQLYRFVLKPGSYVAPDLECASRTAEGFFERVHDRPDFAQLLAASSLRQRALVTLPKVRNSGLELGHGLVWRERNRHE